MKKPSKELRWLTLVRAETPRLTNPRVQCRVCNSHELLRCSHPVAGRQQTANKPPKKTSISRSRRPLTYSCAQVGLRQAGYNIIAAVPSAWCKADFLRSNV